MNEYKGFTLYPRFWSFIGGLLAQEFESGIMNENYVCITPKKKDGNEYSLL